MQIGSFKWTTEYLAKLWEIIRRDPAYRAFCVRHDHLFRDGLLLEEAHLLSEAEQVRRRFGLNLIHHHSITFTPDAIVDALVFREPFATRHIYAREGEVQGILLLSPLAGDSSILVQSRLDEGVSLPQVVDEVIEWARSAGALAGAMEDGQRRRTRAIEMVCLDAGVVVAVKVNIRSTRRELERELRRLAGAREKRGSARRKGARGSLMASLRHLTPETLAVFDLHAAGVGVRDIIKKRWPKECADATMAGDDLDRRLDQEEALLLSMGFSRDEVDARLDKLLDGTIERLEARVWEKVNRVRQLLGIVTAWST